MQKPRGFKDESPADQHRPAARRAGLPLPVRHRKAHLPVFDPIAQKAFDANYDGEEDVNGLTAYKFSQNVGYDADGKLVEPVKYPSLYDDDADAEVTARASLWGLPGNPDEPITMTRYYAAQRTFWVDPVSGTIVKKKEHGFHYYAREALKPEVTFVDYTVTSTEETVESQVAAARDERDRLALWGRILPITFTAIGLGRADRRALLGSFSLRAEIGADRSGSRRGRSPFFGRAAAERTVPGAEAQTEKLPTPPATHRTCPRTEILRLRTARRPSPQTGPRCVRCLVPAYALVLALLVTAPLLSPGYLLLRDAVSTPRSYLSDAALGLEAAPRALPQDFAVALTSGLIDGGVVVKALLVLGCCWRAGVRRGWRRWWCPTPVSAGQFVAVTIAIWNPYVAERLLQGHWSLVVGYGCLPWVATTMLRCGRRVLDWAIVRAGVLDRAGRADPDGTDVGGDGRGDVRRRAGCRPAAVVVRGSRPWARGAGGAAMADRGGGWPSPSSTQARVSRAFAARAEPGLGTLGSLASLGGIWNGEAVPASRTTLFAVVAAVVLLAVVALGCRRWCAAPSRCRC